MKKQITAWILTAALTAQPFCAGLTAWAAENGGGTDPLSSEQWAFYNDGTFSVETEKNRYPVYDDPFGTPAGPGEWSGGTLLGYLVQMETKQALAGIDIGMKTAWEKYDGGKRDAIVAVIDTGIDYSHEDLQGALWTNSGEIPNNGIDDDGNGYIDDVWGWNFYDDNNQVFTGSDDSHGTHGAGTIRGTIGNGIGISGMASGDHVKIMSLKALGGKDGGGDTSDLIEAIRYAENQGAVICNLSLTSTTDDPALYQAIKNSDMLFVVAAGNGDSVTGKGVNTDEIPFYPAAYDLDNIISVANVSFDGALHETSNYGASTIDLGAPGTQILSTTPGNSYGYMTGTSMAAPMVAGAAAMVYSYYEGISAADVKEILLASVTPLDSLNGRTVTGGMLNVGAALSYDTSALSSVGFTNSGRSEGGTAPILETRITDLYGDMYLTIRAIDIDGDLETLLYAVGEHTAEEFEAGLTAEAFTVNSRDMAMFKLGEQGVYTFYARDKRGNSSVRVIEFAPISQGPGARRS